MLQYEIIHNNHSCQTILTAIIYEACGYNDNKRDKGRVERGLAWFHVKLRQYIHLHIAYVYMNESRGARHCSLAH